MYKLSAVLIGLLIAIMVTFNGVLSNGVGEYRSILIIHIIGFIAVSLILIFKRKKFDFKKSIPKYLFLGGVIGVVLIFFNNICFKHLGVSLTLALGLFGQSVASVIIDHFGLLGMKVNKFNSKKIVGFVLISIGLIIMLVY